MEEKATQTPEKTFSMEEALQETEARLEKRVRPGQVLTGKVVLVGSEGVAVDIGAKTEGIIPFNQLTEKALPEEELKNLLKPGDTVRVQVIKVDPETGQILLSRKKVEAQERWDQIQALYEKGEPVTATVKEKVKGGVVADLDGVEAFIPASQLDLRRTPNLDAYLGQPIQARIIEFNRKKGRVLLSRRVLLEEEQKKAKEAFLQSLQPGQVVEGTVADVTDFGAFVNLGPVDGLVHRSEITWGRFGHPREVIQKGQKVRAQVLSVDPAKERVNLSIKALIPDPWTTVAEKYPVGTRVRGKVVGLTPFGAFVEVEPGLEGLIHISELSWTKRPKHPSEVVKEGDEVEAVVLRLDPAERRLSLGLKQTQPDPWQQLTEKYPPGSVVKGRVTGVTDFGVFVEVEPGMEGLVHVSELDHGRVENPAALFKKGDEMEVVVLNIDPVEQRISLSRKRLLPPPPPKAEEEKPRRPKGKEARGKRKAPSRREERREYEYGAVAEYNLYDASAVPAAAASVKLGDLYGDLLASLGLEEEK
ncbi:small subunit ribosomal protein S1 [Thermus arciformis]|uniref:Small ribosomal subunit protein bS1 n=1 Tax=Thermus arciformis TaxID=482827 RepID=A0A1G7KEI3_9DEIN|nr:30S ribosomal protein S1 [Thermus arciformis]SDF35440.1 small subunit ribosomal protein S1 [Thermus arciformis]